VSATDVSDDGTVIVGYGTLDGTERAFRVTLPSL
jgi:probable HAF family extracellular repeat protein